MRHVNNQPRQSRVFVIAETAKNVKLVISEDILRITGLKRFNFSLN